MQNTLYLNGVTFIAPGAEEWSGFADLLRSDHYLSDQENWSARPECVSPRSRRRLSPQTLLAIAVAENLKPSLHDKAAWVFASAFGEGETLKVILDALRTPEMAIRPPAVSELGSQRRFWTMDHCGKHSGNRHQSLRRRSYRWVGFAEVGVAGKAGRPPCRSGSL